MNVLHLNPIFQAGTNHRYGAIDYHQIDLLLGDTWVLRQLADELYRGGMHIISDGVFDHCGDNFPPFLDVVQTGSSSKYANWFNALSYPLQTEPINYLSCGGFAYPPKFKHAYPPLRDYLLLRCIGWMG